MIGREVSSKKIESARESLGMNDTGSRKCDSYEFKQGGVHFNFLHLKFWMYRCSDVEGFHLNLVMECGDTGESSAIILRWRYWSQSRESSYRCHTHASVKWVHLHIFCDKMYFLYVHTVVFLRSMGGHRNLIV